MSSFDSYIKLQSLSERLDNVYRFIEENNWKDFEEKVYEDNIDKNMFDSIKSLCKLYQQSYDLFHNDNIDITYLLEASETMINIIESLSDKNVKKIHLNKYRNRNNDCIHMSYILEVLKYSENKNIKSMIKILQDYIDEDRNDDSALKMYYIVLKMIYDFDKTYMLDFMQLKYPAVLDCSNDWSKLIHIYEYLKLHMPILKNISSDVNSYNGFNKGKFSNNKKYIAIRNLLELYNKINSLMENNITQDFEFYMCDYYMKKLNKYDKNNIEEKLITKYIECMENTKAVYNTIEVEI